MRTACHGTDDSIRVTGPNPDDEEDWLVGETLDGTRSGGFPKVCASSFMTLFRS